MSYGLIYTVPFADMDNVPCRIEIEKENYTGQVRELVPAETPFTVDVDDNDFLYTPIRFSTAVIRVVGSDYLQSLFSTAYQEYRVTFKKNNVVTWCGFIKPELYTQEYSSGTFELELECMSTMSTLEYIDYRQAQDDGRTFVSLWWLLKKCITAATANFSAVNIPHVYAKNTADYASGINVLDKMTLSEQDFFDEDGKPMKLKEVLEEVCKFLNWTCVDWMGELYFVDVDHNGEFYRYAPDLSVKAGATSPSLKNIQAIGFTGSEHKFDILTGYNKVTVKCSNYCVGTVFPEEDFDKLNIIEKYMKTDSSDPAWPGRTEMTYLFLTPSVYTTKHYEAKRTSIYEISEDTYKALPATDKLVYMGASLTKSCTIKFTDGVPSATSYDFEDRIHLCVNKAEYYYNETLEWLLPNGWELLKFGDSLPCACYLDGAISINMSIMTDGMARQKEGLDAKFNFQPIKMYFRLKIGDKYYNGSKWVTAESTFAIDFDNNNRSYEQFNYIKVKNTKTLSMPYNGMEGYIIPIEDGALTGIPELTIVGFFARGSGVYNYDSYQFGCYIKDIKVVYQKKNENVWIDDDVSDRIYENIINESYINEMDEIEFKISSYNNDGACYSKVMLEDKYLTDNLYSSVEDTTVRPEEHLIRRIIKRYSSTRIKLTQVIKSKNITPITRLSDTFMVDKKFIVVGGSIDYKMNRFECVMIEV